MRTATARRQRRRPLRPGHARARAPAGLAAADPPLGAGCRDSAMRATGALRTGYSTFTFRVVAPAFFGSVSSSTPSVYFAVAVFSSTSLASVKLRDTAP